MLAENLDNFISLIYEELYYPIYDTIESWDWFRPINTFIGSLLDAFFNMFHDSDSYIIYRFSSYLNSFEASVIASLFLVIVIVLMVRIIKIPFSILESINKSTRVK